MILKIEVLQELVLPKCEGNTVYLYVKAIVFGRIFIFLVSHTIMATLYYEVLRPNMLKVAFSSSPIS